jgi:serine/threonine protein kinase
MRLKYDCMNGTNINMNCKLRHSVVTQALIFFQNTVVYTDPKILQGKLPSEKSDVYSLGITCWQLLSREVPYEGYTLHAIIYKVSVLLLHVYFIMHFTLNLLIEGRRRYQRNFSCYVK